jgi:GTPase SAR1 family protein
MGCASGKSSNSNNGGNSSAGLRMHSRDSKEKKVIEAKIVLLGETGVGKSSLAMRYCLDKFTEAHEVTIGGAYLQQTVTLANNQTLKLHIWYVFILFTF